MQLSLSISITTDTGISGQNNYYGCTYENGLNIIVVVVVQVRKVYLKTR